MAKLGRKDYASILLALAGSAVLTLLAAPELPAWSTCVLVFVAGASFTGAAYLLGIFRAPVPIGTPVRAIIVFALIWWPMIWLLDRELPSYSFPYIKPGVVFDPGGPNATWVFLVVNRGHKELHNVKISFRDLIRAHEIAQLLRSGAIPQSQLSEVVQSDALEMHYPALARNTTGGNDNEDDHFFWKPPNLPDESYEIVATDGNTITVRELIAIKNTENGWQYAIRVTNEKNHRPLIECRDPRFPADNGWGANLPRCFPDYQVNSGLSLLARLSAAWDD
jgi:hypothetical protein